MPYVKCPTCKKTWKWDGGRRRGIILLRKDQQDQYTKIREELVKEHEPDEGEDNFVLFHSVDMCNAVSLQMIEQGNMMDIVCPECDGT